MVDRLHVAQSNNKLHVTADAAVQSNTSSCPVQVQTTTVPTSTVPTTAVPTPTVPLSQYVALQQMYDDYQRLHAQETRRNDARVLDMYRERVHKLQTTDDVFYTPMSSPVKEESIFSISDDDM